MATVPAVALRRAAWGLALLLAPVLTGCVGLPVHPWGAHEPPAKISQVVVAWQNTVSLAPDPLNAGRTQPVLAARMYLFGPKLDFPMVAQGGFKVELFDDSAAPGCEKVLEDWKFRAEDMPGLIKKDFIGIGYTVLLPWGSYRPDITKVRMRTSYQPPDGLPIYSESLVTLDVGNGIIRDATGKITPASFKR